MLYTRLIAKRLGISIIAAEVVKDFIDSWLEIDWSEASKKEINRVIDEAASEMNINAVTTVKGAK